MLSRKLSRITWRKGVRNKPYKDLENSIRGRRKSKCKGLLVGANFERSRKGGGRRGGHCDWSRKEEDAARDLNRPNLVGQAFWLLFGKQWKTIEGFYAKKWNAQISDFKFTTDLESERCISQQCECMKPRRTAERKALETASLYSPEKLVPAGEGTWPFQSPSLSLHLMP